MAIFQVVAKSGPTAGNIYQLEKTEMFIGRELNNDIVINDPEISRRHARLFLQGEAYVLEDLGSTNGSMVNNQRLMGPCILNPGDLITLGEVINLTYEKSESRSDNESTWVAESSDATSKIAANAANMFGSNQTPEPLPIQGQPFQLPEQRPSYQQKPVYAGQVPNQPQPGYGSVKKKTPTLLIIVIIAILLIICICGAVAYFAPKELWCAIDIFGFFTGSCP